MIKWISRIEFMACLFLSSIGSTFILAVIDTHVRFQADMIYQTPKLYDDVIKWKHFPRYWPFVRGIHRSPVNSPHKGQWRGALKFPLICLNKRFSKLSWGWWFETPSRSLWRHRNAMSSCQSIIIWHKMHIPHHPMELTYKYCGGCIGNF